MVTSLSKGLVGARLISGGFMGSPDQSFGPARSGGGKDARGLGLSALSAT
ncbi:hypothetical protein [Stieleria bergensis]